MIPLRPIFLHYLPKMPLRPTPRLRFRYTLDKFFYRLTCLNIFDYIISKLRLNAALTKISWLGGFHSGLLAGHGGI